MYYSIYTTVLTFEKKSDLFHDVNSVGKTWMYTMSWTYITKRDYSLSVLRDANYQYAGLTCSGLSVLALDLGDSNPVWLVLDTLIYVPAVVPRSEPHTSFVSDLQRETQAFYGNEST